MFLRHIPKKFFSETFNSSNYHVAGSDKLWIKAYLYGLAFEPQEHEIKIRSDNGKEFIVRRLPLPQPRSRLRSLDPNLVETNCPYLSVPCAEKIRGLEYLIAYPAEETHGQFILDEAIQRNQPLPYDLLSNIAKSGIIALLFLDKHATRHGFIQPRNFSKQKHMENYQLSAWDVYNFDYKHIYSAPEIYRDNPFHNPVNSSLMLSDTFSLGLVLLQMSNLIPQSKLTNEIYQSGEFQKDKLAYYLDAVRANYSSEFSSLIAKMLETDPYLRESFLETAINMYASYVWQAYSEEEFYEGPSLGKFRLGKGIHYKDSGAEYTQSTYFLDHQYGRTMKGNLNDGTTVNLKSCCDLIFGTAIATRRDSPNRVILEYEANQLISSEGHLALGPNSSFVGKIINGLPEGYGTYILNHDIEITGNWSKGVPSGEMTMRHRQRGFEYVGELDSEFKPCGKGTTITNESIYTGEFENGAPNSQGKVVFENGITFEGAFENGVPNGEGILILADGSLQRGTFLNMLAHGKIIEFTPDGSVYEGNFKEGIKTGQGRLVAPDGRIIEGEFRYDRPNGKATISYANGEIYEGELLDGLRHGYGKLVSPHLQTEYEGEWKDDMIHGTGKMRVERQGWEYEGEFKNSLRHGFGTITFLNSAQKYRGEWENDVPEGEGKQWMVDGAVYQGEFRNGVPSGHGRVDLKNGDYYIGDFQDALMHGKGTYFFKSGAKYIGEFNRGVREGYGKYIFGNGVIWKGDWVNNNLEGEGVVEEPNGLIRVVEFKHGRPKSKSSIPEKKLCSIF